MPTRQTKTKKGVRKMESKVIPRGCDGAKLAIFIETRAIKGSGYENDPCREVIQYWSFDGKLIFEIDPVDN